MEDLQILYNENDFNSLERPGNIKKSFYLCVCPTCQKQTKRSYLQLLHDKSYFYCMRHKTEKTLREKYGNEHYVGKRDLSTWKAKVQKTMEAKYGVQNAGQMPNHSEKIKNTLKNNFGSLENAYTERQKKINESKIKKYKSLEVANKAFLKTLKEKYGVSNPSQLDTWKQTRIKNLNEKYSNIFSDRGDFYEENNHFYFKCKKCGQVHEQTNNDVWRRCLTCFPINKNAHFSAEQNEIEEFLRQFTDVKSNQKSVFPENGKLELDIMTSKFSVEYDGAYWHNNHKDVKKELCEKNNIELVRVYDFEWQDKNKIVKSILKSKLGIFDKKVYARKCHVKEVDSKTYNSFCEENHIQGSCKASVKIGLFFENELVEIMSFGRPRYSKDFEWEMIRECSAVNTHIIGGKSKLLKYFERVYRPKSIISYCDRRYFDGHSYEALGFNFEKVTPAAFSVYDGKSLKSRANFTKQKMKSIKGFQFNESLSQIENILENNLIVLWDNGTKVYTKKY